MSALSSSLVSPSVAHLVFSTENHCSAKTKRAPWSNKFGERMDRRALQIFLFKDIFEAVLSKRAS